jgi:hypothetical protein
MRSPRLSLTRRQLRVAIKACDLVRTIRSEGLDALVSSDASAEADYLAIRGELTPRQRRYHPVARRALRAKIDVLHARRDIRELEILREKLQAALDKGT